ncbi:glycosyltransferase [Pseudaestuariivita atlantica]|nr:glycosyltransferase [Pseudaestuariivita atlantica]
MTDIDVTTAHPAPPGASVIVPAHNEAAMIGPCLRAVLESDHDGPVQCVVVANGCTDDTVAKARAKAADFAARGWEFEVLDLPEGGKPGALNAGDAAALHPVRIYLDADVEISPALMGGLVTMLDRPDAAYASGRVTIPRARTWVTRAYARFYRQVPFMTHGVPGCGLFAVNAAGRARWGDWPGIISDDTFARLNFAPQERHGVDAPYSWPLVEGWDALVRVRRRQNAGVDELARSHPALMANDDKPRFGPGAVLAAALKAPAGFAVYGAVALAVRATRNRATGWSRGR